MQEPENIVESPSRDNDFSRNVLKQKDNQVTKQKSTEGKFRSN